MEHSAGLGRDRWRLDGALVAGQVELGSVVVVSAGGISHSASVDDAGHWQAVFAPGELAEGAHQITVTATDAVGSVAQSAREVIVDTTAPVARHTKLTLDAGSEVAGITVASPWRHLTRTSALLRWMRRGR